MSNPSTALDPNKPATALSFDEWEDLGPMGRMNTVTHNTFDRSPRDDNEYPGADDREKAVRERTAHIKILFRSPMGNPGRERDLSEHEGGHALHAHYRRTLLKRDAAALGLFNALARAGNDALNDAAKTPFRDFFTVVAPTRAEAVVVRKMIDYALTVIPPDTALTTQSMLFNPANLPSEADLRKALDASRPALFSAREDGRRVMGIVASQGSEDIAAKWAKAQPANITYVPAKPAALWNALIQQDVTKDGKSGHYRIKLDWEKASSAGAQHRDNEKVVNAADQVVVIWNGKDDDAALTTAAYAARHGKLYAVFDAEGRRLDADMVAEHAMKTNLSRAEFARSRNAAVFETVQPGSPEGRLGMDLMHLNRVAQDAFAATPFTLGEIVEMAKTPEGQQTLFKDHKITAAAIRSFQDERRVSDARENLMRIIGHCREHDVAIVGPESFPKALAASGRSPSVLFVQAKDPQALKDLEKTAALLGDDKMLPHMTKTAAELATALDRPGVTLVQAEDQGMPKYVPDHPSVLVLSTGHGQFGQRSKVEWANDAETKTIRGEGRAADYSIRMEGAKVVLSEHGAEGKDLAPDQDRVVAEIALSAFKGVKPEEAKTLAVRRAKDLARTEDEKRVQAPLKEFRQEIVNRGGFVVSPLPPVELGSFYSAAERGRVSLPATRTDETRGRAVELAARMSDMIVATQLNDRSVALKMVPVAAELSRPVVALTPPEAVRNLPEVAGNVALIGVSGKELPSYLGMSGTVGELLAKAYGNRKAATAAGRQMNVTAEKIAGMLESPKGRSRGEEASLG